VDGPPGQRRQVTAFQGAGVAVRREAAEVARAEGDLLVDRVAEELIQRVLEEQTHIQAHAYPLAAIEDDPPALGGLQPGGHQRQRALARAILARQGDELTRP